jgi:hypothetical protein
LLGEVLPLIEAEGLERSIVTVEDDVCVPFEEQRECATRGADIDRLPEAIQDQHVLV